MLTGNYLLTLEARTTSGLFLKVGKIGQNSQEGFLDEAELEL